MDPRDRRRHPRAALPHACKLLDPRSGRYHRAAGGDLSRGGLRVALPRTFRARPGEQFLVAVPPPEGITVMAREAMVPARVVRVVRHGRSLDVAMSFELEVVERAGM